MGAPFQIPQEQFIAESFNFSFLSRSRCARPIVGNGSRRAIILACTNCPIAVRLCDARAQQEYTVRLVITCARCALSQTCISFFATARSGHDKAFVLVFSIPPALS